MKLTLQVQTGWGMILVEASSIIEFEAAREYLTQHGVVGNGKAENPVDPKTTKAETPATTPKTETAKAETPSATEKATKGKKAETPKAEAEKPATAAATAKTGAGVTWDDVVESMTKVADTFSVAEALVMNKRFGVKKAGELKEEQWADYVEFANDCLANKRAPSAAQPKEEAAEEDVSDLV